MKQVQILIRMCLFFIIYLKSKQQRQQMIHEYKELVRKLELTSCTRKYSKILKQFDF